MQKLKQEEIDINTIKQSEERNGTREVITLKDIVSEDILNKYNLDKDYRIGPKISTAKLAYKGRGKCILTSEDRRSLEELGLIINSESSISKLIDILEILKQEGIDVSKIKQAKSVNGEIKSTILSDVVEQSKIEKYDLDSKYNIGRAINQAKSAYKGTGTCTITEEEKRKLEELGIIKELSKKEAEQQKLIAKRDAAKQLCNGAKVALNKKQKEKQEKV